MVRHARRHWTGSKRGRESEVRSHGIPWLRCIRQRLGEHVHFWPFDGWDIPAGRSAFVEVYPALWSRSFARGERNADQYAAYSVLGWFSGADRDGASPRSPSLDAGRGTVAQVEG